MLYWISSPRQHEMAKVEFISSSRSGDAAISSSHVVGWDIVTVRDPRKARRVIEEHDVRVGLALCECGPDRRGEHLFEQLTDELEAEHMPVQWIALLPAHPPLDDNLSRLIGQRFFDFHTLPLDPNRLVLTLGHAYGMASLRRSRLPVAPSAEAARGSLTPCYEHTYRGDGPPQPGADRRSHLYLRRRRSEDPRTYALTTG